VKDWFNRIVKDALFRTVDLNGNGPDGESDGVTLEAWIETLDPVVVDYDENLTTFDLKWVQSPTEGLYKSLTRYERYLLFLTYAQDLGVAQIAEKLERDKDTIKRHVAAVLEKIKVFDKERSDSN
jgi:DNA-directed RNA polymerase specialized sigma24 family protein